MFIDARSVSSPIVEQSLIEFLQAHEKLNKFGTRTENDMYAHVLNIEVLHKAFGQD